MAHGTYKYLPHWEGQQQPSHFSQDYQQYQQYSNSEEEYEEEEEESEGEFDDEGESATTSELSAY